MHHRHSLRTVATALTLVGLAGLSLIGSTRADAVTAKGGAGRATGTITIAEAPGASPSFILPYMSCAYASTNNVDDFQRLMFRPLYWFGLGHSVGLIPGLSLAKPPHFSDGDRSVTITMKGWRFADGQEVDAQSVMFFLNLWKANPTAFCGYNEGYGIPDQVANASGSGDTVRVTFRSSVNPIWILDNYLDEITPLPNAWDVTAPGKAASCATGRFGAAATDAACRLVDAFLDSQSIKPLTYTDRLWQSGVDGPWRLTNFNSVGAATFQPNPAYAGPQRAQVRYVKEVPFASADAEENALQAGDLTIGYVDPSVLTADAPAAGEVGANWAPLVARYQMVAAASWSVNFALLNFSSADPKSAAISQLYVRQALQDAVDQAGLVATVDRGYGSTNDDPLPYDAPPSMSSPVANPYPFDLAAALALLASHGWSEQNDVQTCVDPGTGADQCGPSIPFGYTLSFNLIWASGSSSVDQTMNAEILNWESIGVQINSSTASFNTVANACIGGSGFEICSWGNGWEYPSSAYPTDEGLFTPGGGLNLGSFSDPEMTGLVNAATRGSTNLTEYATYAAKELPVLYQPEAEVIDEVSRTLQSSIGIRPNPLGDFTPEYYHF